MKPNSKQNGAQQNSAHDSRLGNIKSAAANGMCAGSQAVSSTSPIETAFGKLGGSLAQLTEAINRAESVFDQVLSVPQDTPELAIEPASSSLHAQLLGIESQVHMAVLRLHQLADRSTL